MKILMTTDTVGGVWTYAVDLCTALAVHDIEVVLATMGAPLSPNQRERAAQLGNVKLYTSSFKLEWMQHPWSDVERAGEWLLSLATREGIELVHLNGYAHGALNFGVPKVVVAHSCVLSWWQAVNRHRAPPEWNEYQERVRRGVHAADILVAPTSAMLEQVTRWYGVSERAQVILNGKPHSTFAGEKHQYVLSAGRLWDRAKNMRALDAVAAGLCWPVKVAGESQSPEGAGESYQNLVPLGPLSPEELGAWFAHAPIYALPAYYEPFGLSVLEAAHASCALVLGDIPSLRELWEGAAWFVSPDDPEQLTDRLSKLINDRLARSRSGCLAAMRAQNFGAGRMAHEYNQLYRQLNNEQVVQSTAVPGGRICAL